MDPLAEKFPNKTPYHYSSQNPVNLVDPDGKDDYINEDGVHLGTDYRNSDVIRVIKQSEWDRIHKEHYVTINIGSSKASYDKLISDYDASSRILDIEDASSKFAAMWNESLSTNPPLEKLGFIVYDFENAKLSFHRAEAKNASPTSGFHYGRAGEKLEWNISGFIIANVHTHPTEHEYLGKISGITGKPITDRTNFNEQYQDANADGNRAAWQGANYTISKYSIDYFSPRGKDNSTNNLMKRSELEGNGTKLLRHAILQYKK